MTDVPKGAKKPADRKPKVEAAPALPEFLTGEADGFTVKVERTSLDDFELLDDLARLDDGERVRLPRLLRRLLGDQQMAEVMDFLRDKSTGRVSVGRASEFISQLMVSLNPNT